MKAQGYKMIQTIVYQDSKRAMLLENNGQLSSSQRTKHINVRHCFIKDCIERGELQIQHKGTYEIWANLFTKSLQGKKLVEFRKIIMNLQ